ncbi:hypothetical protein IHE44_0012473 [Lamprotornis superbus]|uniref:Myotrophin n=1 Tax=Lamprotornis superbus TaxID=245042 RepID=A0A835NQS8_9PASS|nr:hypothetical protein IHE44_0012473 [Lamprotornis superbus]
MAGLGEDVNRTLEGGRKPLHYAADCGQLEILEFLLLKGADINAPDKHNITPLLSAVYEGHVSCVKLLLSKGADKTVKGPDGLTAFEATDNQAIKTLLQLKQFAFSFIKEIENDKSFVLQFDETVKIKVMLKKQNSCTPHHEDAKQEFLFHACSTLSLVFSVCLSSQVTSSVSKWTFRGIFQPNFCITDHKPDILKGNRNQERKQKLERGSILSEVKVKMRLHGTCAQSASVPPAQPVSATAGFHLSSHRCISQWHQLGQAMECQDTSGTDQLDWHLFLKAQDLTWRGSSRPMRPSSSQLHHPEQQIGQEGPQSCDEATGVNEVMLAGEPVLIPQQEAQLLLHACCIL